ncbi:hypothetical protein MHYP_G00240070 [Metynnis hypsauchen]
MLRWRSWEMAALALLEDVANGRIRREHVFRDHYDFLAHDDDWLISHFRFPRAVLLELCAELGPVLEREAARSRASPVPLQVLTALGFLATGSFQRELADRSGVSQSSLSRAMPAVLDGVICMSARYIKFPYDAADQANIKAQFAAIAGFPDVIGAIDCTHTAIKAPSEEEFAHVIGSCLKWRSSRDSGYALQTWLMTPLCNPQTDRERRYNSLHSRTRSVVERAIGQLKSRWRCLDRTGGMLLYRPEKLCRIVRACGVLHNVAHRTAIVRTRPVGRTSAAGRWGALEVSVTPDVPETLEEHPKSVAAG